MSVGPVEYIVVEFPGNQFKGEIVPELKRLVDSGTVRILDLVFVLKDADGEVTAIELDGVDNELTVAFADVDADLGDLLNDDDIAMVGESLEPNCSAALLVWENTWATAFAEAVRGADGQLVAHERIPHDIVMAAIDAADA